MSTDTTPDLDEYVREQLEDVDREVLRALVKADSPLSDRARRALEYLDAEEQGGQE